MYRQRDATKELNRTIQLLDDMRRVLVSTNRRTVQEIDKAPKYIKTNNTVGLESLPREILCCIVDYLLFQDVKALSLTSR